MMKKFYSIIAVILLLAICILVLVACNDTISHSNKIFVTDFSETQEISVEVNVKNHTDFPNVKNYFEYKKDIDSLYEKISSKPKNGDVRLVDNTIIIDKHKDGRCYSCIIYKYDDNRYIVHSMTYTLGEWANNLAIFFPSYTLDKQISKTDDENTLYHCSLDINALKEYYSEHGYYTEIKDNELRVICLLRYPDKHSNYYTEGSDKALSWSIVYKDDNTIGFSNVVDDYQL